MNSRHSSSPLDGEFSPWWPRELASRVNLNQEHRSFLKGDDRMTIDYDVDQNGMSALLNAGDSLTLALLDARQAVIDRLTDLRLTLQDTTCLNAADLASDDLTADARSILVRCENVVGGGRELLHAIQNADQTMADDALGQMW